MSIKDDVNFVKQELSSDEKMLEGLLKVEKVYKKHKFKLLVVVVAIILAFGGNAIKAAMEEARLADANSALLSLQKDANNASAQEILKAKNPALYELYSYSSAVKNKDIATLKTLSSSTNPMIADLSKYHVATLSGQQGTSKYYDHLSKVQEAYVAIEKGKTSIAKDKLSFIEQSSPLHNLALILKHRTLKVEK